MPCGPCASAKHSAGEPGDPTADAGAAAPLEPEVSGTGNPVNPAQPANDATAGTAASNGSAGQADPGATGDPADEPGEPATDTGGAAPQAPLAGGRDNAAEAAGPANAADTAAAAPAAAPANASADEPAGTTTLPVVTAATSVAATVPAHTPTPPPVAASTPDAADAVRSAKRSAFAAAASSDPGADAQRRSEAREAALAAKPLLARLLQTVLAIAYPFLLLIGAIKLVASPWFLWLEYNRPGFPADSYGFSAGERLTYGSYGVDYLNNAAGPEYLGGLMDLSGNPLFLNTEVAHMADVKAVIAATFTAGLILLVAAAAIALYLSRRYAGGIRRALFAGAVSTIGLMVVLGVLGTLNWRAFFTGFHSLFFSEGTWTFSLDDTLIRLYPTQFWVDSAISVAGLVVVVSVITLILTWPTARRRERSRLRQEARDFGLNH